MFEIGQKIICLDPTWGCPTGHPLQKSNCPYLPTRGALYCVRSLQGEKHLRLDRVVNPIVIWQGVLTEPVFENCKYSPVVSRQTSIEIFTRMLLPANARETV